MKNITYLQNILGMKKNGSQIFINSNVKEESFFLNTQTQERLKKFLENEILLLYKDFDKL